MNSPPTVSIIMAVYNGAALLPATIESLFAQSFTDWELIAVDDCSKDSSAALLETYSDPRIKVIRAGLNEGPVVARNRAFAAATGRYIAGLDQDDICLPERFAQQVAFLDANPDTVLVSSAAELLTDGRRSAGGWPRPLSPALIDWLLLIQNPIVWSSVMFRAEAGRKLRPLERPDYRYVEDFDLYERLRPYGRLAQIDEVLLLYRVHAGGASNVFNKTMTANAERVLRERHCERLGVRGSRIAALLVRHVMAGDPVPNAKTLYRLAAGIRALRADFGQLGYLPSELADVDAMIGRLWWRLVRAGVRSGNLMLHETVGISATVPGFGQAADLVASQVIGGVRAVHRAVKRG